MRSVSIQSHPPTTPTQSSVSLLPPTASSFKPQHTILEIPSRKKVGKNRKKVVLEEEESQVSLWECCANPCCCFNLPLDKGSLVVAILGLIGGACCTFFGLWCGAFPELVVKSFSNFGIINENSERNAKNMIFRKMLGNIGWLYFGYGLILLIVNSFLFRGIIRREGGLCKLSLFAKIGGVFLFLFGLFGVTVIDRDGEDNNLLNNPILFALMGLPVILLPFELYLMYIVTLFAVLLEGVEIKIKLFQKRLSGQEMSMRSSSIQGTSISFNTISSRPTVSTPLVTPTHHLRDRSQPKVRKPSYEGVQSWRDFMVKGK